jgi:hypothetical protein
MQPRRSYPVPPESGIALAISPGDCLGRGERSAAMLWTIFVILLILWLLGMITSYTLGGFIHILLVIALVVLVIRLIQGRGI